LLSYLWDPRKLPKQLEWSSQNSQDANIASMQAAFQHSITQNLTSKAMELRGQTIPKAFEKTYPWIFQSDVPTAAHNIKEPNFPEWLENDTKQLYRITGKPGSGKSTMVHYILQHPYLRKHLSMWDDPFPLLLTCHYAWLAGADLQKSREGLMRTLLHQSLREYPSLVPVVAPGR